MANWNWVTWILAAGGVLIIGTILFFVLRELFCWYWKINHITEVLEEIRDRLPQTKSESSPEES